MASAGDYLYIADLQGFYIVDISTPSSPQGITYYPVNGCINMVIVGDRMYMAVGVGVLVLDVSDPVNPVQIGQGELPFIGILRGCGRSIYLYDGCECLGLGRGNIMAALGYLMFMSWQSEFIYRWLRDTDVTI